MFAEDVRSIPGVDVTQVIFRLTNNAPPGTYQLQLFALGQSSNFGTIRIKPSADPLLTLTFPKVQRKNLAPPVRRS